MNDRDLNHYARAYSQGVLDGYNEGIYNNPFDGKPQQHRAYRLGYDYGVTLYCEELEKETP